MTQRIQSDNWFPHFPGYHRTELICESHRTRVYRSIRDADQQPVILKLLRQEPPALADLLRLRNHYTLAHALNLPTVARPLALEPCGQSLILIMPDQGYCSLDRYFAQKHPTVVEVLRIAIQLAEILHHLSRYRIIHKDIKPDNILIHPATGQVQLTDFGLASQLPQENPELRSPGMLEGTLAYLSPEQTGRMNRGIDYRSDFYSLGVTCYELLTGQLPFQSDDPLELVYHHLVQDPVPPHERVPALPAALSQIVLKLMAKNAEDRYQSALGLKADLEQCLQQLETTGTMGEFEPGRIDALSQFNIPQKLYGRETQVATLLEVFERVSQGSCELVTVSGYSGIGKTALVHEILRQLTRHKGYLASGKFDQVQRNVPLGGFLQAYRELVRQLLTESEQRLDYWRERLLYNLGANAQLMIDAIPELELITGPQAPVPELGAVEAAHRLVRTFNQLAHVFQSAEHPQVVFMDDVQWSDRASLQALQSFMTSSENHYALIILAYRDNEVDQSHPLIQTVEAIRQAGTSVTAIHLAPLGLRQVGQLVSETLRSETTATIPLSNLLFEKTGGNPFFLIQLLKSLHEDGLIWFRAPDFDAAPPQTAQWQWNLSQIQHQNVTDNVIELMVGKIVKLEDSTQRILQLAACIGSSFNLQTLATVSNQTLGQTAQELWEAIQAGLVVPVGQGYRLPQIFNVDESIDVVQEAVIGYRFLHDRVQQAAYALIPEDQKQTTHARIGRLLWQHCPEAELGEQIFAITSHLNRALEQITQPLEQQALADLNLIAAQKAKAATAYVIAQQHLQTGLLLLPSHAWNTQHQLTQALYELSAEVHYLLGDTEKMEQDIETVLNHTTALLEQVKVYELRIQAYSSVNRMNEAVEVALTALRGLGIDLPSHPTESDVEVAAAQIAALLVNQPIQSLLDRPPLQDPEKLAAMRLLSITSMTAYLCAPNLFPLNVFKQVELSVQYGYSSASACAYTCYGLLLCGTISEIPTGYQFGQLALKLLESGTSAFHAKTLMFTYLFVMHWQEHLRNTLQPFLDAYQIALTAGELEDAALALQVYSAHAYFCGLRLDTLEQTTADYAQAIDRLNQQQLLDSHQIYHQAMRQLLGAATATAPWVGVFDEALRLPQLEATNNITALFEFHLHKLILCCLFANWTEGRHHITAAEPFLDSVQGLLYGPIFEFYRALIELALCANASELQRQISLEQVTASQTRLQQWADYAPMNQLHRCYLVEAERLAVLGQRTEAIDFYDRAIAAAQSNGYIHEAGLANERAAQFYLAWAKPKVAAGYLQEAYDCYAQWGARAKLMDLETRYSSLLAAGIRGKTPVMQGGDLTAATAESAVSWSSSSQPSTLLDLRTILKASQVISQEIQLERLLSTLMQAVIENAGAQTGTFILKLGNKWQIVARCSNAESCHLEMLPLEQSTQVPLSLIYYVQRTQDTVVLDLVTDPNPFRADPYWLQQASQSILCVPVLNQGNLIGILYLENQAVAGAFTRDRQEVVQLIAAQAAISLEHARFYSTLEQKVTERTQELSQALTNLQAAQQDLIQAEKMAALGQLTASVAHEINTPLGVIRGATANIAAASETVLQQLPALMQHLSPQQQTAFLALVQAALHSDVELSTKAERQLRYHLQDELRAQGVVAVEPIASQFVMLGLGSDWLPYQSLLLDPNGLLILEVAHSLILQQQNIRHIQAEVDRAAKIVFALKTYSHRSPVSQKSWVRLTDTLEVALTLYQNRLKQKIQVTRHYAPTPPDLLCQADELTQVWVNLIDNAIYAMGQQGHLEITVVQTGDALTVAITDSGCGIPVELQSRIFEPFFTTKPRGEGSGLGLDIVQKIIQKHGGHIQMNSQPGRTTFTVMLPLVISESSQQPSTNR